MCSVWPCYSRSIQNSREALRYCYHLVAQNGTSKWDGCSLFRSSHFKIFWIIARNYFIPLLIQVFYSTTTTTNTTIIIIITSIVILSYQYFSFVMDHKYVHLDIAHNDYLYHNVPYHKYHHIILCCMIYLPLFIANDEISAYCII